MKFDLKNKCHLLAVYLLVVSVTTTTFAQNEYENHKKYWYYKTRLNNDFIKIGTGDGCSIPANERMAIPGGTAWDANSFQLKWGDASARLGIYLSVLATEYRLLKNNGQDLSRIKHELFCALNAVNRIDYNAESIFSEGSQSGSLNGFFIRDDVPINFVAGNYKHFNYYNSTGNASGYLNDRGFTQTTGHGMKEIDCSRRSVEVKGETETAFESQDQAYYLLMGLALTSKLVDDVQDGNNVFGYGSGGSTLQSEAKAIAERIITHIKSDALWRIRNPANGNAFVEIGAHAETYAYALDNLGCFIKYNQDLPAYQIGIPIQNYPYNSCTDFSNMYSRSIAASSAWQTLSAANGGLSVDGMGFFQVLAGSSNSIFEPVSASNLFVQNAINAAQSVLNNLYDEMEGSVRNFLDGLNMPDWLKMITEWVLNTVDAIRNGFNVAIDAAQAVYNNYALIANNQVLVNTTDYRLYQNTKNAQTEYFSQCHVFGGGFPIAHQGSDLYFGTYLKDALRVDNPAPELPASWLQDIRDVVYYIDRGYLDSNMENILNAAPCNGNYNFGPSNNPGPEWGASDRIDRPDKLWRLGCDESVKGEYAGLDYMLLHNLYYLVKGTGAPISDYSTRQISASLPFGNWFTSTNKGTIGAYEFLNAENTISNNGSVNYRAGKEIALTDGFSAESGSELDAYIEPYNGTCNNTAMSRGTSTNVNTSDMFDEQVLHPKPFVSAHKTTKTNTDELPSAEQLKEQIQSSLPSANETPWKDVFYANTKLDVYPNPNSGEFTIILNLKETQTARVTITDIIGRKVYEKNDLSNYTNLPVKLDGCSKGVYLTTIHFDNGIEITKRIILK